LTTTQIAALIGDVTSTAGNPATTVIKLQGSSVSSQTPALGQVLTWNGTAWTPATGTGGGGGGGGANGLTYYFNQGTAADAPTTGIPQTPHQLGRTAETVQSSVTIPTLTQNTWTKVAGFVSESTPIDPDVTSIPAGIWDFNIWAFGNANTNAGTSIRALAYIYNGTTLTLLGTSGEQVINGTSAQYSLSVVVSQTAVNVSDRIYIEIQAYATASNHNVTAQFGDGTPSHCHTSLPLVGGSGLWKSIDGVVQSPASLLVNADVADNAQIAVSKISGAITTTELIPYALTSQLANYVATSQLTTLATAGKVPQLDGTGKISTVQIPALTTSQISGLDTALNAKLNTSQLTTLATANGVPQLDATGKLTTVQIPALTTSQVTGLDTALAGKVNTSQLTLSTVSSGVPQLDLAGKLSTAQIPALTTGQVTGLDAALASKVNTSQLTTLATAGSVPQLTGAGTLSTVQIPALNYQSPIGTISGIVKGAGANALTAAVAGTDYVAPNGSITGTAGNVTGTVAVANGGTGGTTADEAANNLGFPAQIRQVVSNVNLGTGTTSGYVYTATTAVPSFVAHSILTAGDNILCSGATNTMNLGPWVVTTTGYQAVFVGTLAASSTSLNIVSVTSGTVAVGQTIVIPNSTNTITIASFGTFNGTSGTVNLSGSITQAQSNVTMASGTGITPVYTRPAWFRGTLLSSAYYFQIQRSSSAANGQGNTYSIYPTSASESLPSVTANASGGTAWSNSVVSQRASNATLGSNTFTSSTTQTFAAGTLTTAPIKFQAGTIATTPVAHSVEWDGTWMYTTTSAAVRKRVAQQEDRWTISATAATGIIAHAIDTQEVLYYTTNATADFTLNLTGAASTGLNVGSSRTVVFLNTNGTTAYKATAFQIDGVSITPKYQGGSITGNASATDMYSVTIVKTAATPTYSMFVTLTKFA
jgi:hypothetical protein